MKLREFDLDAPESDKAARLAFRGASRVITAHYERCFGELEVRRGWKAMLECVPRVKREDVRDLLGVLTMQVPFDIAILDRLDAHSKKQLILETLHSGVLAIGRMEGWPPEQFERAKRCVLDAELVNEWWWGRPKWNPARRYSGQIWSSHELDAFRAWIVIRDRTGVEQTRKQVLETSPDEFEFVPQLGSTKWTSPTRFALFSMDKREVGAVDVGEGFGNEPG